MSVVSLSGRKYGVHKKIVCVHAAILKEAKYKLKLSLKVSNSLHPINTVKIFQYTEQDKDQEIHHTI